MNATTNNILLLLGGGWHDFEEFAQRIKPLLEDNGYAVTLSYDIADLCTLEKYNLLLMFTWIGGTRENSPPGPTGRETASLVEWIRKGGALIPAHAATVMGQTNPDIRRLMGGVFINHPDPAEYTIYPCFPEHPVTKGMKAFKVFDELYRQKIDGVKVLMSALYKDVMYPMVWTREEGDGRIIHLAMGHDEQVWDLPEYHALLVRSVEWALKKI